MGTRYGSDKEVAAVTFNLKEQRFMEKKMHTLKLEESYSLKLLELDHRIIKVNYRRLKDRVSRIHSFLTVDEITDLKELEASGKLKPTYNSLNLTGALKIASAAKRLKLNGTRPSTSVPTARHRLLNKREEDNVKIMKRCHSVTGVFMDAQTSGGQTRVRRESSDGRITINPPGTRPATRPKTAFVHEERHKNTTIPGPKENTEDEWEMCSTTKLNTRPATSVGGHTNAMTGISRRNNGRAQTAPPAKKSRNPYSSHDVAEKDARTSNGALTPGGSRERSLSVISNGSIDSNLGENLFEERRQELIEIETQKGSTLESKRKDFLKKVEEYVELNPLPNAPDKPTITVLPSMTPEATILTSDLQPAGRPKRTRRKLTMVAFETGFNEEEYQRRIKESWKNLNKCRYLRLPDERVDLSGYNTLATDQLKLLQALRKKNLVPFLTGVQVTG